MYLSMVGIELGQIAVTVVLLSVFPDSEGAKARRENNIAQDFIVVVAGEQKIRNCASDGWRFYSDQRFIVVVYSS